MGGVHADWQKPATACHWIDRWRKTETPLNNFNSLPKFREERYRPAMVHEPVSQSFCGEPYLPCLGDLNTGFKDAQEHIGAFCLEKRFALIGGDLGHVLGLNPQADGGNTQDGGEKKNPKREKGYGISDRPYPKGFWVFLLALGIIPGCLIGLLIVYLSNRE